MKRTLLTLIGVLMLASVASANPACVGASLATYISSYSGYANACQIGDLLFYNFSWTPNGSSTVPAASSITVTPEPTGTGSLPGPGIKFNSALLTLTAASSNPLIDVFLSYDVLVTGPHAIDDYSLAITGSSNASGSAKVVETFSTPPSTTLITQYGTSTVATASVAVSPVASVHVSSEIIIAKPTTGLASISVIREHFEEVNAPEPYSMLTIGAGLLLVGWKRRKA
jgi:hypothetical protein